MTSPTSPRQVIAGELDGAEADRLTWAGGILAALTEHGYAVMPVAVFGHEDLGQQAGFLAMVEPDDEETASTRPPP